MQLGKFYRDIREAAGLKQSEIASKMGIHSAIISEFENKGTKLSAFRLDQMFEIITGNSLFEKKNRKTGLSLQYMVN